MKAVLPGRRLLSVSSIIESVVHSEIQALVHINFGVVPRIFTKMIGRY